MRKGLAAAGVVALITAGSAACGADKTTPQGKVGDAFQKLGQQKTVTLGLAFDGSTDQIYSAMKGEDDFTRDDATLLSSLRLSLSASSQKSFSVLGKSKSDKGSAVDFSLLSDASGAKSLAEIRVVDQKLYLRVDIKGLEKLDTSKSDSKDIDGLNQFVNQADQLPANLASVKAALKGQWISLDPKAFETFAKSLGATGGAGTPATSTPSLSPQSQQQLVAGLKKALSDNVTYTELGSKNGADHVKVTVPARQFTKDVAVDLAPVLKQIPGFKQSDLDQAETGKGVPNKNLSVDVAVKNGTISAVTFDIAQLDSGVQGSLPLTLTLNGSAKPVSAPAGAQTLNPQDIMGAVMSGMNSDPDNSSSGSANSIF